MWFILIGLAALGFFALLANLIQGAVEILKVSIPYIAGFIFLILIIMCIAGVL